VQKAEGMALADLPPGTPAKVLSLEAEGALRRRLLDLGLVAGTQVSAIGRSPSGDPTAYRIRGAVMALRAEVTGQVRVLPLHTSGVSEFHQEGTHEPAKL
jgi:ferrous iron transport protein A